MTDPTILDTCRPKAYVLRGAIVEADFAPDLASVACNQANTVYHVPIRFFADACPARSLENLLAGAWQRKADATRRGTAETDDPVLTLRFILRTLAPMRNRENVPGGLKGIEGMGREERADRLETARHDPNPGRASTALRVRLTGPRPKRCRRGRRYATSDASQGETLRHERCGQSEDR